MRAFSRRAVAASFNAFDRTKTGSARTTPKSDIAMLARIQHFASLNCISHRIVSEELYTSCPVARRSLIYVGWHSLLHSVVGRDAANNAVLSPTERIRAADPHGAGALTSAQ